MWETLLDALLDSLKVLAFVFGFHVIFSFLESRLVKLIEGKKGLGPLMGGLFGCVPQCGVSVVAADMYAKRHITIGTVVAVFIACSDEALPIVFSNIDGAWYMGFALLGIKLTAGILFGYLLDLIMTGAKEEVHHHHEHCEGEDEPHRGCCGHDIEGEQDSRFHRYVIHPLLHSLKIFAYVLTVNVCFGLLVYWIGEGNIASFLEQNRGLAPLFAYLVGLIPNCASSVLLAEAYNLGNIPFGALLTGLSVNAGLGMIVMLKNRKDWKSILIVLGTITVVAIGLGYAFLFI